MRLMARVLAINSKHKDKTGTVIDFDSDKGLIIIGFDDGTKDRIEKSDLLQINDLEAIEFEIGQKIYLAVLKRVGKIICIKENEYSVIFDDETIIKTVINQETDFILA